MQRTVFFVSDRTGITAETLGHSLLTQFDEIAFEKVAFRFIDSIGKSREVAQKIDATASAAGVQPIVFSTLVDPQARAVIAASPCIFFDLFDAFIEPLEQALGARSVQSAGRSHGLLDEHGYAKRIEAIDFALIHDDGAVTRGYDKADIILLGVSRTGKTPTCLYLALRYGLFCANYPLTDEDLTREGLPAPLKAHKAKLFGLTIRAERLSQIRSRRRAKSTYASPQQCDFEVRHVEGLYRANGIPHLDVTAMSIEEIATTILHRWRPSTGRPHPELD